MRYTLQIDIPEQYRGEVLNKISFEFSTGTHSFNQGEIVQLIIDDDTKSKNAFKVPMEVLCGDVVWSGELLDGGRSHTQKEWKQLLEGTGWSLPSVSDYEKLCGNMSKDFALSLSEDLRAQWLHTAGVLRDPFTSRERPVVLGLNVSGNGFLIDANVGNISWPARGVKK